MSVVGPNPYASMEIPNVDMVRKESQDLHELQKRDVELIAKSSMFGAALDLHVRERDKAAAAKLREAAATGGGGGPK